MPHRTPRWQHSDEINAWFAGRIKKRRTEVGSGVLCHYGSTSNEEIFTICMISTGVFLL